MLLTLVSHLVYYARSIFALFLFKLQSYSAFREANDFFPFHTQPKNEPS